MNPLLLHVYPLALDSTRVLRSVVAEGGSLVVVNTWTAVLSALFGAVAAVAAAIATRATVKSHKRDLDERAVSKKEPYYRSLVADPTRTGVSDLIKAATTLLDDAEKQVNELLANGSSHTRVNQRIQTACDDLAALVYELWYTLAPGLAAWDDVKLARLLREALEELQDQLTKRIARLALGQENDAISCRALLHERAAPLYSYVMQRDPGIRFWKGTEPTQA